MNVQDTGQKIEKETHKKNTVIRWMRKWDVDSHETWRMAVFSSPLAILGVFQVFYNKVSVIL